MKKITNVIVFSSFLFYCGCGTVTLKQSNAPKDPVELSLITAQKIKHRNQNCDSVNDEDLLFKKFCEGENLRYLVISGGGQWGAFGAGLLSAWVDLDFDGKLEFDIVTGVSTGALIAPFAYIGTKRAISTIECLYTSISDEHIYRKKVVSGALFGDGIWDRAPLDTLMEHFVNDEMTRQIADIYDSSGRELYVLSVNLTARQPTVWDLGVIASEAVKTGVVSEGTKLIRKAITASAALPALFPAVYFPEDRNGNHAGYHVDGGVRRNLFFTETIDRLFAADWEAKVEDGEPPSVFVIRNGRDNEFAKDPYEHDIITVLTGTISSMLSELGLAASDRIYIKVSESDWRFSYIEIPKNEQLCAGSEHSFDKSFMRRLAGAGRAIFKPGAWSNVPPSHSSYRPPDSSALCENTCFDANTVDSISRKNPPPFCNDSDADRYTVENPLQCPTL